VDKDAGGFAFVEGDFTAEPAKNAILERGPFDIVLCDAAPATTGVRLVDTARSEELAASALLFAETALRTGGSIVIKLFQGDMTAAFPRKAGPLFNKTCLFKPRACRSESFETYFIGLKRR
jgi:23S rRNA (uridine2552-2'-O)-methyltransferase